MITVKDCICDAFLQNEGSRASLEKTRLPEGKADSRPHILIIPD